MIIGLTGTFAGGKDTVADYLVKEKGFGAYQTGDVVREYVKKRNRPLTRDAQREMANELRKEYGPDFLVNEAIKRVKEKNKVITGIRQPNEAEYFISTKDAYLFSVDAPMEIRFQRMKERGREGDPINIDELKEKEAKEMFSNSTDKSVQNISYCMKLAQIKIDNSGSKEKLYRKVDKILEEIYVKKNSKK